MQHFEKVICSQEIVHVTNTKKPEFPGRRVQHNRPDGEDFSGFQFK